MKTFFSILILTLLILPSLADARSGCCSHHDGVCGCGCCDGTPLSATCRPYYPSCSSPKPSPKPIVKTEEQKMSEYINSIKVEYLTNPHGYREELLNKLKTKYYLNENIISKKIYTTLLDVKN